MIIAFANQKGGTAKTTSTVTLAHYLSKLGKSVLVVDLDPQASATNSLMKYDDENENSLFLEDIVYSWIIEQGDLELLSVPDSNIKLAPSSSLLSRTELELSQQEDSIDNSRAHRLKKRLDTVKDQFDFVFIDCPGNTGLLTINGLTAADHVVVVTSVGKFERNSTKNFLKDIEQVIKPYNTSLNILGILLTMVDPYPITDKTRKKMKSVPEVAEKMFRNEIPKNNAIRNAIDEEISIWIYDPFCASAKAYMKVWSEIEERINIAN